MAFFKSRKASAEQSAPAPALESVEAMRKRARYRLSGAAVLVAVGVIGFPLLFDHQPRPIAVDIPIDIPDRDKAKPLSPNSATVPPEPRQAEASAASTVKDSTLATASVPELQAASGAVNASQPVAKEADKEETIIVPTKAAVADSKPVSKSEPKTEAKAFEPAKTADKVIEKHKDQPAANGRYVVQFGAFTEAARAHEARVKVEKIGLKTYAQVAETPEGKKYRVRVGPFEKRADAEKAAEKIKKLELPAAILVL